MDTQIWLKNFENQYGPLLDIESSAVKKGVVLVEEGLYKRKRGFITIFDLLFQQKKENFYIIETGTVRKPNNWKDGNSGFLFTEMIKTYGGFVRSVDINQTAVDIANNFIDQKFYKCYCSDSVAWLNSLNDLNKIDLFYLDSYDVKWHDDSLSAAHHLKEFQTIEPHLKPGCIVAIDDNSRFLTDNKRTGKGRMIVEYLESKGVHPIYDAYQIIYKF
jgi:hypothetical protein